MALADESLSLLRQALGAQLRFWRPIVEMAVGRLIS
jgi:hypothetical protein